MEILLIKGANCQHFTASACVGYAYAYALVKTSLLLRKREGRGPEFFSGFYITAAQVVCITAVII